MNRMEILTEAIRLTTQDRNDSHGNPFDNHKRIADVWSVILDQPIKPYQVALCMAGLKIARLAYDPTIADSTIDGAAYLAIAHEILEEPHG